MSAPPSIDAYDAQMLDFSSDPDVPMNITAAAEFFAEALMDHDGHLSASTYGEHVSVEVDMEEYIGDNAEYEMADETAEYNRSHGDELLDIEVYDASHVPSPLVPPQLLQPSTDVLIDSERPESTSPSFSGHAALPELPSKSEAEAHLAPQDHPAADAPHVEPAAVEVIFSESAPELAHSTDAAAESVVLTSESHEQLGDTAHLDGQTLEGLVPADADEAELHIPPVVEENPTSSEVVQHENSEPPTVKLAILANAEDAYDNGPLPQVGKAIDQAPATEGETVDPLRISDGVYIDPPPAVLLSLGVPSEFGFSLFNQPGMEDELTEETHGEQKVYSLLLESRPTLYYEPLSSVFEVLRQDEGLLSRIPNGFEGELVLDAYDLQLAISEDNIHSREISLHDLNILHDGSDFAGPLRLLLRAIVPRFIIRYYALQDRIQRLNVVAEAGEGEHGEEHHEEYSTGEEQPQPQQEEAVSLSSTHAAIASEASEVPRTTDAEGQPIKESVSEPSEETTQENYELGDTSAVQEPTAEYHEVTGEATHALEDEDEDDYEGTNVGDEDESTKSESLDADRVHEIAAEDTDAPATVTGQELEFGGERTEYLDYVQPEEYDERYGEDLPERAGAASPVQYGEPSHYGDEGEQDTSTAVDQTQVILPGSEEGEEDKSRVTPIPVHAVLEPESSEFADEYVTNDFVSAKNETLVPSSEPFATGESANEVEVHGDHEPSTAQAKIFSELEESDSNFVSMLEREADAEFDRTFNTEQSGQEGSIEATLQNDEAWDEWDDEDAEGEDDEDWIDPDVASNESSVTLSSKVSSKRSFNEVDPNEEFYVENPRDSPGLKRPRVQ